MKIVLATGNSGKVREFHKLLEMEAVPFTEVMPKFEIVEDGETFAANALIKAKSVYERLGDKSAIVLADDSGISLPVLDHTPGIYSARFAGESADDKQNLQKLIDEIKQRGLNKASAYYTAAIALAGNGFAYVAHGRMHGEVITTPRGTKGFGYDPIFVPEGFDKTLGELDSSVKSQLSHRAKGVALIRPILQMLQGKR